MATTPDPRPPAQQKSDTDNRSRQLNPNHPAYEKSRAEPPPQAPRKK